MVKWIWEEIYIRNIKSLEVVVVIMVYYSLEYFGLFFLLWKQKEEKVGIYVEVMYGFDIEREKSDVRDRVWSCFVCIVERCN